MNKKVLLFFSAVSLSGFAFLLAEQLYFFAAVVLLSQMTLLFGLISTSTEEPGDEGRPYLKVAGFAFFALIFTLLLDGEYRWPASFDWAAARDFHLTFRGEWLFLISVCVAFTGVISALIVRKSR